MLILARIRITIFISYTDFRYAALCLVYAIRALHQLLNRANSVMQCLRCPEVAFIDGCIGYHSTAGYELFHTHLRVWVIHTVEDPAVTVKSRTAIKALSFYCNLYLSVMLDSVSCSFISISVHTNKIVGCTKSKITIICLFKHLK